MLKSKSIGHVSPYSFPVDSFPVDGEVIANLLRIC